MPPPTVLIVDDDRDVRETLAALARVALPHETVETCEDGLAALPFLTSDRLKLVISDYLMPELDGMALAQTSNLLRPRLPFMLMSTFDDESWDRRVRPLPNVLAFIHKPPSPLDFIATLKGVFRSSSQSVAAAA